MSGAHPRPVGALPLASERRLFRVWAPERERCELLLGADDPRPVVMSPEDYGYHAVVAEAPPGTRYRFRLDGSLERPDPASRLQPEGVHGPSEVVETAFPWTDEAWSGVALRDLVVYELHVGAFTPAGTFEGVIEELDRLAELGITALELMPVCAFPGDRNWGYDGVYPYAVQVSYGGPEGLKRLVDVAHARGLAVLLDVVYNHLGPEGNYLRDFGPYFTDRHRTPWGEAIAYDGPHGGPVRAFFRDAAVRWVEEFHLDGLRFDAVDQVHDASPTHVLTGMVSGARAAGERAGRRAVMVAESALDDPRWIRPPALGGIGFDAVWADDLHHALHARLTGERDGYYADYGPAALVARSLARGFAYTGERSRWRGRPHGAPPEPAAPERFVVCLQNHDQVGNRAAGERIDELVDGARVRAALGTVLLSPFTPLLFMGQERAETTRFPYFTSHGDPELAEAVRRGRREEFAAFAWTEPPPDPQAPATFEAARLTWEAGGGADGDRSWNGDASPGELREGFHRELLRLRRALPALRAPDLSRRTVWWSEDPAAVVVLHPPPRPADAAVAYAGDAAVHVADAEAGDPEATDGVDGGGRAVVVLAVLEEGGGPLPFPPGRWRRVHDSREERWGGEGAGGGLELVSTGVATPDGDAPRVSVWVAAEDPGSSA